MKDYIKYLSKVLGVTLKRDKIPKANLIHVIDSSYIFDCFTLHDKRIVFAESKYDFDSVVKIKSHYRILTEAFMCNVVLVFSKINYRQREALIKSKTEFVVPDRQIFLPSFGVYLQEIFDSTKKHEKFRPSTQLLLTYLLCSKDSSFLCSSIQKKLGFSRNTISLDTRILENHELIISRKEGINKMIELNYSPKDTLLKSKSFAIVPYSRSGYVDISNLPSLAKKCGESALANYSMLSEPQVSAFCSYTDDIKIQLDDYLIDPSKQAIIKKWKYDYNIISNTNVIDPASVYFELKDVDDERIQICLGEMLDKYFGGK